MALPHPVPCRLRRAEDGHSSGLVQADTAGFSRVHEPGGQVDGGAEDVPGAGDDPPLDEAGPHPDGVRPLLELIDQCGDDIGRDQ